MTKVKVKTKNLKDATSLLSKYLNTNSYKSLYKNLCIHVKNNNLFVSILSDEIQIEYKVDSTIVNQNNFIKVAVEPEILKKALSESDSEIELEFLKDSIIIKSDSEFELLSDKDIDDFVELEEIKGNSINIPSSIKNLISDCAKFVLSDQSSPFGSVLLRDTIDGLSITGTDTSKLISFTVKDKLGQEVLLPLLSTELLQKFNGDVKLTSLQSGFALEDSNLRIKVFSLNSKYMDMEAYLKSIKVDYSFKVMASDLLKVLNSSMVVADPNDTIDLEFNKDKIIASFKKESRGRGKAQVSLSYPVESLTIKIMPMALVGFLLLHDGDKEPHIDMCVSHPLQNGSRALIFKGTNPSNFIYLTIPTEIKK